MTIRFTRSHAQTCALLLAAIAAAPAVGQRLPLPTDDGRILQLFDLYKLRHEAMQTEEPTAEDAQHKAELLRHFVEPTLRAGDDLCAIGSRWIAVLADAERVASVERMFQAARDRRNDLLTVQVQLVDVAADKFRKHWANKLVKVEREGATSYETVIPASEAKAFTESLHKAADQVLAAPLISVCPLQRANVSVVTQVPYIKDFEVTIVEGAAIADPVIGTVWEGNKSDILATFLPDGRIGVQCDVQFQELHRPIATFETKIGVGTQPVTVQLPRTSGVRLANVAEVGSGALVVLAGLRSNGEYMVAIVKTTAMPEQGTAKKRQKAKVR